MPFDDPRAFGHDDHGGHGHDGEVFGALVTLLEDNTIAFCDLLGVCPACCSSLYALNLIQTKGDLYTHKTEASKDELDAIAVALIDELEHFKIVADRAIHKLKKGLEQ